MGKTEEEGNKIRGSSKPGDAEHNACENARKLPHHSPLLTTRRLSLLDHTVLRTPDLSVLFQVTSHSTLDTARRRPHGGVALSGADLNVVQTLVQTSDRPSDTQGSVLRTLR